MAYVLALAYALHPIHLSVAVGTSHANFPPFYFIQPLVVWRLLKVLDRPTATRIVALAATGAMAAWLDFERVAILTPWLVVLAVGVLVWRRRGRRSFTPAERGSCAKRLGAVALGAALGLMLMAGLLLPAIMEKPHHAMFSEEVRESSVSFFSVQNPLYYLDRSGSWLSGSYRHLPSKNAHDAGTFYLGTTLVALAGGGLVLRPRPTRCRAILVLSILGGSAALASAQGPYSGYESLCAVLDRLFLRDAARHDAADQLVRWICSVGVAAALVVAGGVWWHRRTTRSVLPGVLIAAAAVSLVLFARPFSWVFRHVPPYAEMRNPGWFATAMPPLALAIAAGISLQCLLRCFRGKWLRRGILIAVAAGLAWDIWPYRASFENRLSGEAVSELRDVGQWLRQSGRAGRVLARESYNPHTDLLYAFSGRPAAFYWLNWMAPSQMSGYMLGGVHKTLHRPKTIEESLNMAGWANVRYVIYDLTEGPPPPPNNVLKSVRKGRYYAVYENQRYRPFASLLSPKVIDEPDVLHADQAPGRVRASVSNRVENDRITMEVEVEQPSVLCVSASWYPGWQATVDGAAAPVHRVQKAFVGVAVEPGTHAVELRRPERWYFKAGAAVSGLALLICALLLVGPRSILRKLRGRGQPVAQGVRVTQGGGGPR